MSLYLDLLPAPQFDRSLVGYTVGNFNRIKDLFLRASARTYLISAETTGPWPKSFTIKNPFKADVQVNWKASCWAPVIGMGGLLLKLDNITQGNWGILFFNIANQHTIMVSGVTIRGVAAGDHVWTIDGTPYGNMTSDANDFGTLSLIMTEV